MRKPPVRSVVSSSKIARRSSWSVGVEMGFGALLKPVRVGFIVGRAEMSDKIVILEHK